MDNNNMSLTAIKVDESQIPELIQEHFRDLQQYKGMVEDSAHKAENAKKSAQNARNISGGFGHKKVAIETLQEAVSDSASAIYSVASAQEESFKYSQKLAEFCRFLLGLGISNIAANRSVIQELELRLNGASKKELDDLAQQEILKVVRQLKAQEDILQKQAALTGEVKHNTERLDAGDKKDETQDEELARQASKDEEHDRQIIILKCISFSAIIMSIASLVVSVINFLD